MRRRLPDFAVIGAMRAGTTTLQGLLERVDGLSMASIKETDFFVAEKNFRRGSRWYARQFPRPDQLCGDVSPNYAKRDVFDGVAQRLAAASPDARIVYVVRDPVERAISQYRHSILTGQRLPEPHRLVGTAHGDHIVAGSRYAWQLEPWLQHFGDDNVLILDFAALLRDPQATAARVARFAGLDAVHLRPAPALADNSAESLGQLPGWWLRTRAHPVGERIRALVPRRVVSAVKRVVPRRDPLGIPEFDAAARAELAAALHDDTERFRRLTGSAFAW